MKEVLFALMLAVGLVAPSYAADDTAGKAEADRFLAEGRITAAEHAAITTTPTPKGEGTTYPPLLNMVWQPISRKTYMTMLRPCWAAAWSRWNWIQSTMK